MKRALLPHACSQVHGREHNGCHAGCQEVGRCHTRGEFQGCVTCTPPPSVNKAAHSGFEIQRCHQKSKTRVSVAPQKGLMSSI